MFSLYHSLQKQFIILSGAILVASNLAWSMHICLRLYIGHYSGWYPPWRHPAFVFAGNYFWCTIMFHSWNSDLWNNLCSVNHEQIKGNFSCKYHGAANATIVADWSNLCQYFPKKSKNQDTRPIFSVFHFADKLFGYEYVTLRFSKKVAGRGALKIKLNIQLFLHPTHPFHPKCNKQ